MTTTVRWLVRWLIRLARPIERGIQRFWIVPPSTAMVWMRRFSTDESPQFVNGVLGAVLRNKPSLV